MSQWWSPKVWEEQNSPGFLLLHFQGQLDKSQEGLQVPVQWSYRAAEDPFQGHVPYLLTKQRLTLSCEALGDPVSTHAFGTPTQRPVLPIPKHTAFRGTGFWKVRKTKITRGSVGAWTCRFPADCMGVWRGQSHEVCDRGTTQRRGACS